jgi:hypothetical protein
MLNKHLAYAGFNLMELRQRFGNFVSDDVETPAFSVADQALAEIFS